MITLIPIKRIRSTVTSFLQEDEKNENKQKFFESRKVKNT